MELKPCESDSPAHDFAGTSSPTGRATIMDSDLKRFERELERLSPGRLPEGLIARMEAAMESWETDATSAADEPPADREKVVPFPQARLDKAGRRRGPGLLAAAAGVALLGAVAGLVLSGGAERPAESAAGPGVSVESLRPVVFSPKAAQRKILSASEEGMVLANGAQPVRVLRFDYIDRVVFRNAHGEEVHVEVPAVNYRLIPAVTD